MFAGLRAALPRNWDLDSVEGKFFPLRNHRTASGARRVTHSVGTGNLSPTYTGRGMALCPFHSAEVKVVCA